MRDTMATVGETAAGEPMTRDQRAAFDRDGYLVATCPALAPLIDHPRVLGLVRSILGWNVHVDHSHVDVHPPAAGDRPFRFAWHQDGGRQNRKLETDPRLHELLRQAGRLHPDIPYRTGGW